MRSRPSFAYGVGRVSLAPNEILDREICKKGAGSQSLLAYRHIVLGAADGLHSAGKLAYLGEAKAREAYQRGFLQLLRWRQVKVIDGGGSFVSLNERVYEPGCGLLS